jgi:SAM-dependent methyltransferase
MICGGGLNPGSYVVREMMYGSGDTFDYDECGVCGCLQLREPPSDVSRYYPSDYYAFGAIEDGTLKEFLRYHWLRHALNGHDILGWVLGLKFGEPRIAGWIRQWAERANVTRATRILDVGCGTGQLCRDLRRAGFTGVAGIDPFVPRDIFYRGDLLVKRQEIDSVTEEYDFVMLNHSLEHMTEPLRTMDHIRRVLVRGGFALIRIPVAGSYAWQTYSVDWVQLDAPRHIFVPTKRTMEVLTYRSGFRLASVVYDSDELQFWGSEQYRRGLPLLHPRSRRIAPSPGVFTGAQMREFRAKAEILNGKNEGDSAAFYLQKP